MCQLSQSTIHIFNENLGNISVLINLLHFTCFGGRCWPKQADNSSIQVRNEFPEHFRKMQTETYIHLCQFPAFLAKIEYFFRDAKVYDGDDTRTD